MIICICAAYKSSDLKRDVADNKSLKEIVKDNDLKSRCKKCCCHLKSEYENLLKEKVS